VISYVLAIVSFFGLIAADQITKYIVVSNMALNSSRDFLPGFMNFWYIHNQGGAWGFLEGHTWILLSLTILIMIICVAMLLKFGIRNKLMFWSVTLILSGGTGNMIDRIFRSGKVVDFLHFEFIDFPVFNVADCAIVVGALLLVLYFAVDMYKESKEENRNDAS
jgi:signal peptidase II